MEDSEKFKEFAINTAADIAKSDKTQENLAKLFGMLFPYAELEKKAFEKACDLYLSEIEKSNLPPQIKLITLLNAKSELKKLKNQKYIADIALENAKKGINSDESSEVNQDWLDRFMDSAGFVSDEQMQLIWGRILANEFENPGSTPPNMIRILKEITPEYAQAFQKVCSMSCRVIALDKRKVVLEDHDIIMIPDVEKYGADKKFGLPIGAFSELDTLGLINISSSELEYKCAESDSFLLRLNGTARLIYEKKLPIGNVRLTEAGESLRKITQRTEIPNYELALFYHMRAKGVYFNDPIDFVQIYDGEGKSSIKITKLYYDD